MEDIMGYKRPPSVTDFMFQLRVPNFLVANGWVMFINHSDRGTQRFFKPGETVTTRRHGNFEVMYVGDDHAVLLHQTLSGKVMPLFVPPQKWLAVSNGGFQVRELNYPTWAKFFPPAEQKKEPAEFEKAGSLAELFGKYHDLLKVFRAYWAERFAESVQEDKDSHAFMLGARIRYGMTCVMAGRVIPADCGYQKLAEEVGSWISYREGDQLYHRQEVTEY